MPLYADFSSDVLNFTDTGRILGEVVIRYSFLGKERTAARTVTAAVYNRNTFPPADMAALAAFVSPTSPEVLEFSKYVTGMARAARRTGLNQNLQFGIWLFEGMKVYGIELIENNEQGSHNKEAQFPAQTLAYKSGTTLDAGLLYAAALEAAGIRAAFIPLETDFISLIGLGVTEAGTATLFNGTEKILIVNDEAWLPLSMSALGEGFTSAWNAAAGELHALFENAETAELIALEDAWWDYSPAPFLALGVRIGRPDLNEVRRAADTALNAYIAGEINPLIQAVQRQIQSATGSSLASLHNRLGILLVRAGRTAEAKISYERAAGMGLVPAMTNRGNLALIENDYTGSERWFRQALQIQPDNKTALRGMEQIASNR
jgi:tetratricopeptide (TPR) repeat protein